MAVNSAKFREIALNGRESSQPGPDVAYPDVAFIKPADNKRRSKGQITRDWPATCGTLSCDNRGRPADWGWSTKLIYEVLAGCHTRAGNNHGLLPANTARRARSSRQMPLSHPSVFLQYGHCTDPDSGIRQSDDALTRRAAHMTATGENNERCRTSQLPGYSNELPQA